MLDFSKHKGGGLAAATFVAAAAMTAYADSGWEGLRGKELLEAVGASCRPTELRVTLASPGGVWEAFRATDALPDGGVDNRFSTDTAEFPADGHSAPPTMEAVAILPPQWWGASMTDGSAQGRDLHNLLPAPIGTGDVKRNYPPGKVTTASFDNGVWKAGIGLVDGFEINMYQPPQGYEGDFARAVMYMVAAYPCDFWKNLGENFMTDNFPLLQPWAARQLMAWHNSDPVSDRERQRDEAVAAVQGNHNPFVTNPDLADYIWGEKGGQPFSPDPPQLTPIRAYYSLTDPRIDLYSPHIPQDARWSVDGTAVTDTYLVPATLGAGTHELRFSADGIEGKLKITVR